MSRTGNPADERRGEPRDDRPWHPQTIRRRPL